MGSQFFIGRVYCFCMVKYRIILNIFDRTGVVMDEYRAGETNAVVLAGMCTALAVVLSVIGFYMPLISLVVFLLIPLPIAYLGMKEGTSWSIIVTAGIMILDSVFFGFISAAFLCAIFGVLGVVLGICYRNKVPAAATLAAGAVVVLASWIGQAFAAMYILNVPPMIFGGEAMDSMEQQMMAQMAQFYSGELLMQTQENVKQMIDDIRRSIPVITVSAAFFYTWASMMLGKKIFTRLGMKDIPGTMGTAPFLSGTLCSGICHAVHHEWKCNARNDPVQFGTCLCSRFLASGAGGALVDAQKISFREAAPLDHRSSFRYHRNGADDRRSPGVVRYGASIQEEEKLRIAACLQ